MLVVMHHQFVQQVLLFESVPDATAPVRVSGITLPDFVPFHDERVPEILTTAPEPALLMADFRQQVCQLLKQYRNGGATAEPLRTAAEQLNAKIAASSFHESVLAKMMLEDLDTILHVPIQDNLASQTIQHETFLSVARGLRTPSRPPGGSAGARRPRCGSAP